MQPTILVRFPREEGFACYPVPLARHGEEEGKWALRESVQRFIEASAFVKIHALATQEYFLVDPRWHSHVLPDVLSLSENPSRWLEVELVPGK